MKQLLLTAGLVAVASLCMAQNKEQKPDEQILPLSEVMTHDPVMARQGDTYYLFATGMGISVMSSPDLQYWKIEKPVFDKAPQWAVDLIPGYQGHTWAPDIVYHGGLYHLFYSCSAFGKIRRLSVMRPILS